MSGLIVLDYGGGNIKSVTNILDKLGVTYNLTDKKEDTPGTKIIDTAILEPIKQIAANAGRDGSLIVYNIIRENKTGGKNIGYNAANDKFENMIESGIVDPTKVVRSALEHATSAAIMFLTTEAVITDKPEEKGHDHGMPGGMGGMNPGMMGM